MQYVADISAVLHGSLTPHQILWDLSYARGLQLQIEFAFQKGKYCTAA
jgi:hypothetical protein